MAQALRSLKLDTPPESRIRIDFHPKQRICFESTANDIGYGGAAGGGKSYTLRCVGIIACSLIRGLQVYLFRQHYEELIQSHVDGTNGFRELLQPWVESGHCTIMQKEIRFYNGSKIHLCHCSLQKHLDKYQSHEMHLLLIDQAEQFPERWLRFLRHRVRMSKDLKRKVPKHLQGLFPKAIYSFNPGGVSHSYFRRQYVKAEGIAPMQVWNTPQKEGGTRRQFIPAFLQDNPSLDEAEYTGALMGLNDEQLVKALLKGDFDALIGNFFTQYAEDKHVVPDHIPPTHLFKFRTFDWGSSEPFAVYWWYTSDGEPFISPDKEGNPQKLWFPRGALICYREWYGCDPEKPAKGIELLNEEMALGIIARTPEATSGLTITDNLPFQTRGFSQNHQKFTIADEFFKHGVPLTLGNTDRIYGWKQTRDRLKGHDDLPMIFFCASCIYARDYLPAIERDKVKFEDAVDSGETTHSPDAIRLACAARPFVRSAPPPLPKEEDSRTVSYAKLIKSHLKRTGNGRR